MEPTNFGANSAFLCLQHHKLSTRIGIQILSPIDQKVIIIIILEMGEKWNPKKSSWTHMPVQCSYWHQSYVYWLWLIMIDYYWLWLSIIEYDLFLAFGGSFFSSGENLACGVLECGGILFFCPVCCRVQCGGVGVWWPPVVAQCRRFFSWHQKPSPLP